MSRAHRYVGGVGGPLLESDDPYVSGSTKTWSQYPEYPDKDICTEKTGTRNPDVTSSNYHLVAKTKEAHLAELKQGKIIAVAFHARFTT